jgi:hypothetical protein
MTIAPRTTQSSNVHPLSSVMTTARSLDIQDR